MRQTVEVMYCAKGVYRVGEEKPGWPHPNRISRNGLLQSVSVPRFQRASPQPSPMKLEAEQRTGHASAPGASKHPRAFFHRLARFGRSSTRAKVSGSFHAERREKDRKLSAEDYDGMVKRT